jgi:hypothetical protein
VERPVINIYYLQQRYSMKKPLLSLIYVATIWLACLLVWSGFSAWIGDGICVRYWGIGGPVCQSGLSTMG